MSTGRRLLLPVNEAGLRTLLRALHNAEDAAQDRYAALVRADGREDPRVTPEDLHQALVLVNDLVEAVSVVWDALIAVPAPSGWPLTLLDDPDTPTTRR